ncbi:ATP-binding protein [Streptomyces sp. MMS24-I2-30]|uniref:ATP-binding protein n=1 Tax=Streptomyces sp. MMS24-I2-30 TaxID=3351564 RepID=UPI003896E284
MTLARGEAVRQVNTTLPDLRAEEVGVLRRIVAGYLDLWQMTGATDTAVLCVTELLTNVIRHAFGTCELLMRECPDGRLMIAVTDFSVRPVVFPRLAPDDECGRGLSLVHALSDEIGVDYNPAGKQVWLCLTPSRATSTDTSD